MGFLTPDDPGYNPEVRQSGFNRYRQCLSFYAAGWMKINLLTIAGAAPLAAVIALSLLSSSVLILLPGCFVCGALFGPFLAGLYDAVLRGLRDDPMNWKDAYQKSWKQNWKESLLPGGILGVLAGAYAFMALLFWRAAVPPTPGTLFLYAFSGFLTILFSTLYWAQTVLFRLSLADKIRNLLLFTAKYFWRVAGASLLRALYILLYVLFAPWSLLLLPFLGFWYIVFLSLFLVYAPLDKEFRIEESLPAGRESGE